MAAMGSQPCGMSYASFAVSGSKPAIWCTTKPLAVASSASCRLAAPTSYCAFRLGALFFAKASSATAITSTGAFFAQFALNSTSAPSDFSKFSVSSFVATRNAHGCSLLLEGAQRAASNKLRKTSAGTGLSLNARGLHRFLMTSWTGYSTGAGLLILVSKKRQAALLRSLLDHLQVNRDVDGIAHHHAAAVHVGVPLHAEILAVHFCIRTRCHASIPPGILHRRCGPFHVQHDLFRDAMNRQVACYLQFANTRRFHFLGCECHGRKLFNIKKFFAFQIFVARVFPRIHGFRVNRYVHFRLCYVLIVPSHRAGHSLEFSAHRRNHQVLYGKLRRGMRRIDFPCRRGRCMPRRARGQNCCHCKLSNRLAHLFLLIFLLET